MSTMDVELLARFIQLETRDDDDKNDGICSSQDQSYAKKTGVRYFSQKRFDNLKAHFNSVVKDEETEFEHPFAICFGQEYLPNTRKSIHYRTLYYSLIEAFAKFDKPNRVQVSEDTILISMLDMYLAYTTYHQTYCNILESLETRSFGAISTFLTKKKDKVKLAKEKEKYEDDMRKIADKRGKMMDKNEWQRLWNSAYEHVKSMHPDKLDEWVDSQSKDGKVIVYDPVLRRDVYLCDVHGKVDDVHGKVDDQDVPLYDTSDIKIGDANGQHA
jgi:hypothetical protein